MEGMSGGCGEDFWRVGEYVWKVWEGYLEGVERLSGGYGEVICRVWGGHLVGLVKLSEGCGEAI